MNDYFNEQSHIDTLWEEGYTGKDIRIGIVDTGILDVSLFNIAEGHNFALDGTGRSNIFSNSYHGSIVASLITNIAPDVELIIAKVLNEKGVGNPKKVAKAIRYCISKKCDIINCSVAGDDDEELRKSIKEAYKNNICVVAAAGNGGKDKILYPAGHYYCISVGSINQFYNISTFSNYNALMDLVAPGENITLTIKDNEINDSGTSFSTPLVSGTLALLKEKYIEEYDKKPTWEELYTSLIDNCTLIDGLEKTKQGNGYINIKGGK